MTQRKSPPKVVTQAAMRRAKAALEKEGLTFAGYRLHPDGSVEVLRSDSTSPDGVAVVGEAELAAWKKRHGLD